MKKLTTILLSVLLIASLFVSCDNTTKAVQDELVEVTLSTQAESRSLTVSNPLEALSSVAWTYKATKVTERQFNYGEKTSETTIILYPGAEQSKEILTLSQGKWKFELFGRSKDENKTLLYYGIIDEVLILKSSGLNQITVEVSPYTDAKGSIWFNNVTLTKADNSSFSPNYVKVCKVGSTTSSYESAKNTSTKKYNDSTDNKTVGKLSAGQYEVTVAWKETMTGDNPTTPIVEASTNEWDLVIASETIVVTVYGGRTTEISGNISEETGSGTINGNIEIKTEATQQKTVVADTPTTFTVNVAPANCLEVSSVENTTVSINFDDSVLYNSVAELSIDVKDFSESFGNPNFEIAGAHSAVAGITLALDVIDQHDNRTTVSSFDSVVIETYIVKGLSEVSVKYKQDGDDTRTDLKLSYEIVCGDDISSIPEEKDGYYNPSTGKLVFRTDHFSEYYVEANSVVAINYVSNTVYSTLQDAINDAKNDDIIILLDDIVSSSTVVSMNSTEALNVTLDLNGKTIESSAGKVFAVEASYNGLILKNGTINHTGTSNSEALYIKGEGITLTVDNVVITSNDLSLLSEGTKSHITINKSKITSNYFGMTQNGLYGGNTIEIRDSEITDNSDQSVGIYISGNKDLALQNLIVENSIITGETAIEVKHTNVTITGSTLNATKQNVSYSEDGSGSTTVGYCLALTGNLTVDTTRGSVSLSNNVYNPANPGCEVFNSSAINGVNNGATIEGYDITHVLSPDRLMPVCRIQGTDTVYYSAYDLRDATAATLKGKTVIIQSDELLKNEIYLSGKSFTLDLNGHSLSLEYGEGITPNNGSVIYV